MRIEALSILAVLAAVGCSQHDSYNPMPTLYQSIAPVATAPPIEVAPVLTSDPETSDVPIVPKTLAFPTTPVSEARFVYVANPCAATVSELARDATTGTYATQGDVPTGGQCPAALAADPLGRFLFAANHGSSDVTTFQVDPKTGALTATSMAKTGCGPSSIAVSPNGTRLVVGESGGGSVETFTINQKTGALTLAQLLQFGPCQTPSAVAFDPSGKVFYVAGGPKGFLAGIAIDAVGNVVPVSGIKIPCHPTGIATNALGDRVFVVCDDPDDVLIAVDNDVLTGRLNVAATLPVGADPAAVAVDPSGKLVYVAARDTNQLLTFTDDAKEKLAATNVAAKTGACPHALALDTAGGVAFTADATDGDVTVVPLDPTTKLPETATEVPLPKEPCANPRAVALVR